MSGRTQCLHVTVNSEKKKEGKDWYQYAIQPVTNTQVAHGNRCGFCGRTEETYQDDLDAANEAIAAIVDDVLPDLVTAAEENAMAIEELEESVAVEEANAMGNATLAEEVETAVAKLEILDDYYFIMDVTDPAIGGD